LGTIIHEDFVRFDVDAALEVGALQISKIVTLKGNSLSRVTGCGLPTEVAFPRARKIAVDEMSCDRAGNLHIDLRERAPNEAGATQVQPTAA
jgi:hypothetical protein